MLNKIIQYSLHNRLVVMIASIALLLWGSYTAHKMEVDVFPDLNAPTVVVMTEAQGMAPEEVERIRQNGYLPRVILYDLPGTVNAGGVIRILSSLDAVFIPLKADKLVMESSLTFARGIEHGFVQDKDTSLQAAHLFWTMIDRRERTPLYDQYEAIIRKLGLSLMATHVPYRSKFNKELLPDGTGICRSTLLAPERAFAREAQIEALAAEILEILKVR